MNKKNLPPENIFGHTEKLKFFLDEIARLKESKSRGLRILDLGCGNGWAVTRFLGADGDEVLGIDLHRPSVEYAQSRFSKPWLSFRCADVETLKSENGLWDVVILADVLEHLNDPANVLSECKKLLAPGGIVLVALPNGYGPFEIESALSRVPFIGPLLLRVTDIVVAVLNKFVFRGLWTRAMQAMPQDIPYNLDSPHVQFRGYGGWIDLFRNSGFEVQHDRSLAFVSGPFSNYLLGACQSFCLGNVRVASVLPKRFVSNWSFRLIPH